MVDYLRLQHGHEVAVVEGEPMIGASGVCHKLRVSLPYLLRQKTDTPLTILDIGARRDIPAVAQRLHV